VTFGVTLESQQTSLSSRIGEPVHSGTEQDGGQRFHRWLELLEERKHAGMVSACNIPAGSSSMLMLFPMLALMTDAARVIEIRLRMIALGKSTPNEMVLMVIEKLNAMEEAKTIMMLGGSASHVIDNYQKIIAANVARLSDTQKD